MEKIKIIFSYIGILLIVASFATNLFLGGIVCTETYFLNDNREYIKYRDSVQLELMDRINQKIYNK